MEQRQAKIWFTADTHFNHENIIPLCNRPYKTVEEMNSALTAKWNACVLKKDTVWFLGDFAYAKEYSQLDYIVAALHGKKYFICGNHDKWQILQQLKANGLIEECFFKIQEIKLDGWPITMTHYPMLEWTGCYRNGIQLFGHLHNTYSEQNIRDIMQLTRHKSKHYMNVGVDVNNFQPVSWETIRQQEEAKER